MTDPTTSKTYGGPNGGFGKNNLGGMLAKSISGRKTDSPAPNGKAKSKSKAKSTQDALPSAEAAPTADAPNDTSDVETRTGDAPSAPVAAKPAKKTKPAKVRKVRDSKYKRAMRAVADNEGITPKELAAKISSSEHYAKYLIQTFTTVKEVLAEKASGK